jgi:hypothetical protein
VVWWVLVCRTLRLVDQWHHQLRRHLPA